jgi:hypothetical protein
LGFGSSLQWLRYLWIVWRRFWYLLTGGAVLIAVLSIFERYSGKSASWDLFIDIALICALSALFGTGFGEWRRGLPCLKFSGPFEQSWLAPGPPRPLYWFEVRNGSATRTIENVKVKLIQTEPPQHNLDWLPVHLVVKHVRGPQPIESFSLNPDERRGIDLVSAFQGGPIDIEHSVSGVNRSLATGGNLD